jgi:hypothetical protein
VRATREDGTEVVFVPGELLPAWAADRLPATDHDPDSNVYTLPVAEQTTTARPARRKR